MADKKNKHRGWSYKPGTPILRGFDTAALFTEDTLLRTKWLADGIAESERKDRRKRKLSEREKRNRKIKKELRSIKQIHGPKDPIGALPKKEKAPTDTVKVKLTWRAFSELRRKYPDRVLDSMNTGRLLFTDRSVIMHVPFSALGKTAATTLH